MSIISQEEHEARDIMRTKIPRPRLGAQFSVRMSPGIYNLDESFDLGDFIPSSKNHRIVTDELYVFRDEGSQKLREELHQFWSSESQFKKMGFLHKRGIIIFGPPGSGKSTMLKQEMQKLAEERDQVVFLSKSPWRLQHTLAQFREREPRRPVTVIIEDIDAVCSGYGEYQFLELLDGAESVNHVLFIATTNNMDRLSEKMKRPGRFDRKIFIPNPSEDLRKSYLEKKFGSKLSKGQIDRIAGLTEGLSFGHMREIVVSHLGYGANLQETIGRIKNDVLLERNSSPVDGFGLLELPE